MYTRSYTQFFNTAVHWREADVILSAAALAEQANKTGERETIKERGGREEKEQQGRENEITTRTGSFLREDFLWWDRGIILLGNSELHYEEPSRIWAWGRSHTHCMTLAIDIANGECGTSKQLIVCFVGTQAWLMAFLVSFQHCILCSLFCNGCRTSHSCKSRHILKHLSVLLQALWITSYLVSELGMGVVLRHPYLTKPHIHLLT